MNPGGREPGNVRGRVIHRDGDVLTIAHERGTTSHPLGPGETAQVGDLVQVVDDRLRVVFAHPSGEFPGAGSDALRIGADPGRWDRLATRSRVMQQTRRWFHEAGFLEVETPLAVASPGTEVHLEAASVQLQEGPGGPAATRYLITSPEHHMKRLLVAGAPAIFQICRVFRSGERGPRHRPEFTMLEWYRPWADMGMLLDDCEAWVGALVGEDVLAYQGDTIDLRPPWPRIPFLDALRERGGIAHPERLSPEAQLQVLVDAVEPTLGRDRPEFIVDYPISMASLARAKPSDPSVAERFELYIAGLELANGFGELTDGPEQRRRCEEDLITRQRLGLPPYPLDAAFLNALDEGMPPSAGIAVGMDRLCMLLTDVPHIEQVLAF